MDLFTSACLFKASKKACSEDVARYFADLAAEYEKNGSKKVIVYFDRNSTHRAKMQKIFAELTEGLSIKTEFRLTAAYSPKLNLAEYVIHLIRQKILHHADCKKSLAQFESEIAALCESKNLITKEQIINILTHIDTLVPNL